MNLLTSLFALFLYAPAPAAPVSVHTAVQKEDVSHCFVVHDMYKSEELRYFVDAVSKCSREYEAVYVMVSFLDAKGAHMDDGVWAIYWCRPGRHEVHEFGIPARALGFRSVVLKKITTDSEIALR
jgi:hypothetical protein